MSKHPSKRGKRNTPITKSIDWLETGTDGEIVVDVLTRHHVEIEIADADPIQLNAYEAIRLGKALIKAGKQLKADR